MAIPFSSKKKRGSFKRYREIISLFLKYGFEDVAAHSRFSKILQMWWMFSSNRNGKPVLSATRYERMRLLTEELGPTFIKFAQILSNRPDLLPDGLILELTKLQDKVPPFPEKDVRRIVLEELGSPIEQLFAGFDFVPIASASIAQVHKAQLPGGKVVVLKIQRPEITEKIKSDIEIMHYLAGILENNYDEMKFLQPGKLVKTFERTIHRELNFLMEASNIQQFAHNFSDDECVYVPCVYPEYTTERILCMDYVEGVKITEQDKLLAMNINVKELAKRGNDMYFRQIFEHGFFHADPHPGNLFVLPDHRLCMLDFGMMGHILPDDQDKLGDMLFHISNQDVKKLAQTIQDIALRAAVEDNRIFEYELKEFMEDYFFIAIEDIEIAKVIERLRLLLFKFEIEIPANFHLLMRALVIMEGVGKSLDPKFKLIEEMKPYARKVFARKYRPENLLKQSINVLKDASNLISELPGDIKVVMEKFKKGTIHLEFEHKGLDEFYRSLDVISNRVSFAIVVAALMVGSSVIVLSNMPPYYRGVPVLGLVGYIIGGILAIILLITLIRKGRL